MSWDLFAVCDLCGEHKVILGNIIPDGNIRKMTTRHKCLGCHKYYYFWKDEIYISTNGLTYFRSGKKSREWRIA